MKLLRAQDRGNGRKDLGPSPPPSVDVARKVQERRHHTSMAEADDVDRSCRRQAHDLKMELWVELLRTIVHLGGQTICYATVLRWIGLVGLRDAWDPLRNKI